jgi:predicted DNA-binding protein (MmcQ/YjbR family)
MAKGATNRLRALCLKLPEAEERETWDAPTFRIRGKIFAMERDDDGRLAVWFKAPAGSQQILIGADPDRFFSPPYVGPKGWVGMRLDKKPDWVEVEALITRSYRLIAPKKLVARLDESNT